MKYEGEMIAESDEITVPAKTEKRYIFLEGSAQIFYFHGGVVIKEGSSFNDCYGKDTCIKWAIEEAESIMENISLTPDSSLEMRILHTINRVEKVRNPNWSKEERYFNKFITVDYGSTEIQKTWIWSSKTPGEVKSSNPLIQCQACHSTNGYPKWDINKKEDPDTYWECKNCGHHSAYFDSTEQVIEVMTAVTLDYLKEHPCD